MSAITLGITGSTRRRPRLRAVMWALDLAVFAAALIAYASIPTGAAAPEGVAPPDGRVVVQQAVGSARALVVSRPQTLQLVVAVHKPKGWFGLRVADTAPDGIAWASTAGAHGVASMSVVFGRAAGPTVRIRWADGQTQTVQAQSDGAFLAARPGDVRSLAVSMFNASGGIVREVSGP
ncbi:MAG TPA: hypothetical protein VGW79_09340 [Actinomycetota bacterium]|nr:hypothetical protein [Actinomycetota bacterium]